MLSLQMATVWSSTFTKEPICKIAIPPPLLFAFFPRFFEPSQIWFLGKKEKRKKKKKKESKEFWMFCLELTILRDCCGIP
jgi:hypothetical protein